MDPRPETLADFAARRLPQAEAEVSGLRDALKRAENEVGMLKSILSGQSASVVVAASDSAPTPPKPRRSAEASMQDAVLAILSDKGEAMTAVDLLPLVNARIGADYPRSSLSPQLSRLKTAGKVVLLPGKRWGLTEWGWPVDWEQAAPQNNSADAAPEQSASAEDAGAKGREAGPGGGT